MKMSAPLRLSDWPQMELLPTSSVAGFPAKTSRSRGRVRAWMESEAACTARSLDLLATYDPTSSSWRTSQHCLIEGLASFSETWPRSGMMRSGTAYQLPTLGPGIGGTEFGWLPTPTASADSKGSPRNRYFGSPTCMSNLREWLRDGPDDPIFPHPDFVEGLMGLPPSWSDCTASVTVFTAT